MTREEQHREGVFRWYWRAIVQTYRNAPHAFHLGCGRETLSYWVRHVSGAYVFPQELRMALEEAARRGWIHIDREPGRCTRFFMTHPVLSADR